jgi:hypothetical protein
LAANAADKVVLGPGVKAMAVENTSRAASSEEVMKSLGACTRGSRVLQT